MFNDFSTIKSSGFNGFKTVEQLWNDNYASIPNEKGVYLILNPAKEAIQFLSTGVGGFFKGKNPNISINELTQNWVVNTATVYIGQAGGDDSSATLKKRLRQYLEFGKGKPVGHYGGRLIWQLENHKELLVAWKVVLGNPREEEKKLIAEFHSFYGKLPFANLKF